MLSVRHAHESEIAAALQLQFARYPREERDERLAQLQAAQQRGETRFECLVAVQDYRVVGAQALIQQRDGTVYVWPVELDKAFARTPQAKEAKSRLYQLAGERFQLSGAWIAQSLLEPYRTRQSEEMTKHGFPFLTDLLFLGRSLINAEPVPSPQRSLTWIEYDESTNRDRFAQVLEATYEGTCDCPELNASQRTGQHALEGHQCAGQFDPRGWRIYQLDGEDVGIALLSQHFPDPIWEVVYTGVVPAARGQELGRAILIETLHYALSQGAWQVVLGVDSRNQPALRVYQSLGFECIERRMVHARLAVSSPDESVSDK